MAVRTWSMSLVPTAMCSPSHENGTHAAEAVANYGDRRITVMGWTAPTLGI